MIKIKLKELLKEHKISISEFSENTGLARSTITPLVNKPEDVKGLKVETINLICDYFGIPISDLLEYEASDKKYLLTKTIIYENNENLLYFVLEKNLGNSPRFVLLAIYIENIVFDEDTPDGFIKVTVSVVDENDKNSLPTNIEDFIENNKFLPKTVFLSDLKRQTHEIKIAMSKLIAGNLLKMEPLKNRLVLNQMWIFWNDLPIFDVDKEHIFNVSSEDWELTYVKNSAADY